MEQFEPNIIQQLADIFNSAPPTQISRKTRINKSRVIRIANGLNTKLNVDLICAVERLGYRFTLEKITGEKTHGNRFDNKNTSVR